ncbi:MAG: hypothetical protein V1885_03015 [Candidatus Brennerbacteria bacterium]
MTLSASFAKARLFLRTLQRAPEPVRKKWQFGTSAVAMILVFAGWVLYLNISLSPPKVPVEETAKEGGFFETLGKGFGILGSTVSEEWAKIRDMSGSLWNGLGAQIANPSVFTFVREETVFAPTPYESVAPQTLPIGQ